MNRATMAFLFSIMIGSLVNNAFGGGPGRTSRNQSWKDRPSSSDIIPGVVVVKFKHSSSVPGGQAASGPAQLQGALSERGVTSLSHAFPFVNPLNDADVAAGKIDLSLIHFASIPTDLDPRDVASQISRLPGVEYAEPRYYSYLCDVPNDSDYPSTQQVYFDRMNVAAGWVLQKGNPSVIIATVDGGTNWQHPDLFPNIWVNPGEDLNHNGVFDRFPAPAGDINSLDDDGNGYIDDVVGWNFTNQTNDPRGLLSGNANHGTKTASVFGAVTNNGRGMAGTSWNCRIMPVCAADPNLDNSILDGFDGIAYAAANGARVINCSWGRPGGNTGLYSQYEQDIITYATINKRALIVAAVDDHHQHTDFDNIPFYPAAYKHVLSVGATTDTSDELAYFSQYGVNISVYAPGTRIRVALDNGSYGTDQGTSFSSPLVAGLAGLLVAAHPDWTPDQIAEQIRITADPIDASNPLFAGSLGHGRVNFGRAISEIHAGVTIDTGYFKTPSGRSLFLKGDTLILSVRLRNVLSTPAQSISFNVLADSALIPLEAAHTPTSLGPGAVDSVDFIFRVGDPGQTRDASIKLGWVANANDWDARVFKTTLSGKFTWTKDARNPIFSGVDGTWSKGVFGPCVLFNTDSSRYEMWFNACPGPTSDPYWRPYSVGFAVSKDGINWSMHPSPVLSPSPGAWDSFTTDAPEVLRENGQYKMWYSSYNNNLPSKPGYFGYATSPDGINWTKYSGNPIFGPGTAAWEATGPYGCKVIPKQGGYKMWYDGYNLDNTNWKIGYAESSDGVNWIRDTVNNPVLDVGSPGQWDDAGVGSASVVGIGDSMYMWYVGNRAGVIGGQTGLAVSRDGITNWTKCPSNPVLVPGGADTWDADRACVGTVMRVRDTLHMWYDGWRTPYESSPYSIGHATTPVVVDTTAGAVDDGKGNFPATFLLGQNYPNPFNPSTTITFSLPRTSHVTLAVYDILGRRVSVLVNDRRDAGVHEVKFDGSNLASGMYFYRLQAGDFVQSKKLVILK